ncbi:Stress response protein NhaX [bacterium HR29]|jgi:nucleotide-binding universal stress UspA family protein|nr:Stress response protein NhaX [bacterium HR29]
MRILVPLDGTEAGERVCPTIAALAWTLDADVVLYHVVHPDEVHAVPTSTAPLGEPIAPAGTVMGQRLTVEEPRPRPAEDRTQALARVHAEREDYLREVARRYFPGVVVRVEVDGAKDTAAAIAAAAARLGADGIAMATRARAGLAHALFGSVAERVIRQAPVPVLVVGPHAVAETG